MSLNSSSYESLGRLFGRERIGRLSHFLDASGIMVSPEAFAGIYLVFSLLFSLLLSLLLAGWLPLRTYLFKLALWVFRPIVLATPFFAPLLAIVIGFAAVFSFFALMAYVLLLLRADARRNQVEELLPDFLTLAAANVRAGMTIDQALWYAAKPEFGSLSDEVQVVAKKAFGGVPFNEAIDHLATRFMSRSVRRTVSLIKQGLASGGQIAEILERTAQDARNMQIIKREIAASLLMYVIFVVFATAIATPFLFSVSAQFISLWSNVMSQLPDTSDSQAMAGMSFKLQSPLVTPEQFFLFVVASTLVTAVISSLMVGVIQRGSKREGVRYLPFIMICALVIFFIVSSGLSSFVKGMGGG